MSVDLVREWLHQLAAVLVWPVLVSLILLLALIVIALGAFARDWWTRWRRADRGMTDDLAALDAAARPDADGRDLRLEHVLQAAEQRRWRTVARTRLAIRVGPSLGLMGTLIPMADALQGLADGNLPALASNMVTAFAATVVGLAISVMAYLMTSLREQWLKTDLAALALHAERLTEAEPGGASV